MVFAKKAWPALAQKAGLDAESPTLAANLYAGAIAPDAGYYPGAQTNLARLAHLVKPWDFVATLVAQAETPEEKAFALGWLTHAYVDRIGHRDLVNPAVGGAYSARTLAHKRLEWGLDCLVLEDPAHAWLWSPDVAPQPGLALWQRAFAQTYGRRPAKELLGAAMAAELKEVQRLPRVWWYSGRLARPDCWFGNALGWLVGVTLRPAYVWHLEATGGDIDRLAVISPTVPGPRELAIWGDLLAEGPARVGELLRAKNWPVETLDMDPACEGKSCAQAEEARAWLETLEPASIKP